MGIETDGTKNGEFDDLYVVTGMTVAYLIRMLSRIPHDKLVHVDLADDDGNVWKGAIDGAVLDEDGWWLHPRL